MTTTNLADFGYREKRMAAELLIAMCDKGVPDDFGDDEVTVMMNQNSGNVFLSNSDFDVAMLTDDGKIKSFYNTPYEGHEGFYEDLVEMYKRGELNHKDDIEYLKNLAENRGLKLPRRKKK